MLTAAAGLAVLVAVLTHLAWPPVVIGMLGTVPAYYLAFLAVPGVVREPESANARNSGFGRPVEWWNPSDLGVHNVVGGGALPPYVLRPHDEVLAAALDPGVPASRLVVLRGESSTGKTRAAWEALVRGPFAGWQLDYPRDSAALMERLASGIPPRTVLWLGELRHYVDAEGGKPVLGRLADLLCGEGLLLITTVWPEQWEAYVDAAKPGPAAGPSVTVGHLLASLPKLTDPDQARIDRTRGGVIDVPAEFTRAELESAARTGNPVLTEAAAAAESAGQGGRVAQYLAGVPALLNRYSGPGGNPYGQAVITAGMDAARLGYAGLLSAELLVEAAVGYLTDSQRTAEMVAWRDTAMNWACTELRGAVRAVQPVAPAAGTGVAGYQVADWLEQHGRDTRADQPGPVSLWDALIAQPVGTGDLIRLGMAAHRLGLYRHEAAMWTKAAAAGSATAGTHLLSHLQKVSPADFHHAACWTASVTDLDDPRAVASLLHALAEDGASDAVDVLLARDPAANVSLDNAGHVAELLESLLGSGAGDAPVRLATRAAAQVNLDYSPGVAELLEMLDRSGAHQAVMMLAARIGAQSDPNLPGDFAFLVLTLADARYEAGEAATRLAVRAASEISFSQRSRVADLLHVLVATGADEAIEILLARDPAVNTSVDDPGDVMELLLALLEAGADDAATALTARAAAHTSLEWPANLAHLLGHLAKAGADDAAGILLSRDPPAHVRLDHADGVAQLLAALKAVGDDNAVIALANRAAAHSSLDQPWDVARLLGALTDAGASDAVSVLLARQPAEHTSVHPSGNVGTLLKALSRAGAAEAVQVLAARAGLHASLKSPGDGVAYLERAMREVGACEAADVLAARADLQARREAPSSRYGREPDGSPSPPWRWHQPER